MDSVINRSELKDKAKEVLKNFYWFLFVVSLIIAFTGGNSRGVSYNPVNININLPIPPVNYSIPIGGGGNLMMPEIGRLFQRDRLAEMVLAHALILFGIGIMTLVIIASMVFSGLVGYPLRVGCRKIFINCANAQTRPDFNDIIYAFRAGRYFNIVKAGFLTLMYILLWSLLLVIPGIVKAYAYRFVPYILAEDPNISAHEAITLSMEMTQGHKFDLFVLDLSFFGWYLLGALTFGLGNVFINPYVDATIAQAYVVLRDNFHQIDNSNLQRNISN